MFGLEQLLIVIFLFVCFLLSFLCAVGDGQMVQMDPSKSGFVGSQVELRCIFINSNPPVKISQVTWQKLLNGTKQNVAIANPALGVSVLSPFKERVSFKQAAVRHRTPSLEDTTIVFSNLQLSDEAAYICEYTTFPAGNRENMVNLTVYGKNMSRAPSKIYVVKSNSVGISKTFIKEYFLGKQWPEIRNWFIQYFRVFFWSNINFSFFNQSFALPSNNSP